MRHTNEEWGMGGLPDWARSACSVLFSLFSPTMQHTAGGNAGWTSVLAVYIDIVLGARPALPILASYFRLLTLPAIDELH